MWISNTQTGTKRYLLFCMLAVVIVACGPLDRLRSPAGPLAEPTLDLAQIPVLEDDPAPIVPLPVTDDRYPIAPDARGQALYERHCAACHGASGEGQLPDPFAFGSAPPHDATGHTWHHTDQENFLTVWQGRRIAGSMPGFHDRLSPDEIIQVLAHLKTWWEPDQLEHQMALTRLLAEQ